MASGAGETTKLRYKVMVIGIVQSVGFRPYIYQLATAYELTGYVKNEGSKVTIEVQGSEKNIQSFLDALVVQKPVAAVIKAIEKVWMPTKTDETDFVIRPSQGEESTFNYISPDLGMCKQCTQELSDKKDRRYHYPFINCTHCGPRFSIIKSLPYDRIETTMQRFGMCEICKKEYSQPNNRRFHAEPICCANCGPDLWIMDTQGKRMTFSIYFIRQQLLKGKIIALKGIGGFHLLCDAHNEEAVALLRKRKHRTKKPLALMAKNIEIVKAYCKVDAYEAELLESAIKPILILAKKEPCLEYISETPTLGIMLPYTPLHLMLFDEGIDWLVATSGNSASQPMCYKNEEVQNQLGTLADYFVMHNREILRPIDDSIIVVKEGQMYVIRRARGLVPQVIDLSFIQGPVPHTPPNILAVGAEQKHTFCMTKGHLAIMSQHIGDLNTYENLQSFKRLEKDFEGLFYVQPKKLVGDLHPDYLSSHFVKESFKQKKWIQHHYAHIAACLAENQISHKVIGVAFDGTGYGEDGHIWGGEFFICDLKAYRRVAHFDYVPMPGGEQCIKEPWRMAKAYLYHYDLFTPQSIKEEQLYLQLTKKINCPLTSSVGRLFDAVAGLLELCTVSEYEAQAAILLEAACISWHEKIDEGHKDAHPYDYEWIKAEPMRISCNLMLKQILEDLQHHITPSEIAFKFHYTLIQIIVDVCRRIRKDTGIMDVALGGGVFQNMFLAVGARQALEAEEFCVFQNHEIPMNDGGVSLGQAAIMYQEEKDVPFSSRED